MKFQKNKKNQRKKLMENNMIFSKIKNFFNSFMKSKPVANEVPVNPPVVPVNPPVVENTKPKPKKGRKKKV